MFNLEQSISEWRKQMLAAGIKTPVPLEELEIHLREEIGRQIESGTNPQEAFEDSLLQMGHVGELKDEFRKNCAMYRFQLAKRTPRSDRWSLAWWGIGGLVLGILNDFVLARFVFHGSALFPLPPSSSAVWLPYYVAFTTFTFSGIVIGYVRCYTKWTLSWISSLGLIGTMMVYLVCRFVFHGSDGVSLFLQRVHLPWWAFYVTWMICIINGLFIGFSNRTLWLKKLQPKTA